MDCKDDSEVANVKMTQRLRMQWKNHLEGVRMDDSGVENVKVHLEGMRMEHIKHSKFS